MPFRSPQGEGRFESASARRLRCPFSFACCTASLNGFLTWRSGNGADSSGIAPIPVQLWLFSSRLLANLRENAFQILQRGLWTNSWSRGLCSLCRRSLGTYWGEKWRGGLQCRQCSLVFDPFSLDDRINKISRNVAQRFYSAASPSDFHFGHHGFCA